MSDDISHYITHKKKKNASARSVSEALGGVLEPVISRRAGMTLDLIKVWPELVGSEFQATTKPLKINWPRRANEDDPFEPATLLVACETSSALFFQHELAPVVERVNVFFGFEAIARIQILQRPISNEPPKQVKNQSSLSHEEEARLHETVESVEDEKLRETLEKLGRGVLSSGKN
ncbi:MAG: DciA family protein [Pseudomonadota bacterium]